MYTEDDLKVITKITDDTLNKLELTLDELEYYKKLFYIACGLLDNYLPLSDMTWDKYIKTMDKDFVNKTLS